MTTTSIPPALREALLGREARPGADADASPVKAFAWARVSTDRQWERGLSIPAQLGEIRAYAQGHGMEIVEEFCETASASAPGVDRVEFRRMLAAALGDPEVRAILACDSARFSRDAVRGRVLIRELREAGVEVIFLDEPLADPQTAFGVYVEALLFAKNEAFGRELAVHVRKGFRANIQERDPETGWCYKNGGTAPWGYRSVYVDRSLKPGSRPTIKRLWALDVTVIAGRPVHEWVRHCLLELAAEGATMGQIADFCNTTGIPAPQGGRWSASAWDELLKLHGLLRYCGYGLWDIYLKKPRRELPPSQWTISPNAHPAIITAEEARAIALVRSLHASARESHQGVAPGRNSIYLLGDGLFTCARCGSSLQGKSSDGVPTYYGCGSARHRTDSPTACPRRIFVRKTLVESEVLTGLKRLLNALSGSRPFIQKVNEELQVAWRSLDTAIAHVAVGPESSQGISMGAGTGIGPLRPVGFAASGAMLDQGDDLRWLCEEAPLIDAAAALSHCLRARHVLAKGTPADRKCLVRIWVERVQLDPEHRVVEIIYRLPWRVTKPLETGAWCRAHSARLSAAMVRRWHLPLIGGSPRGPRDA